MIEDKGEGCQQQAAVQECVDAGLSWHTRAVTVPLNHKILSVKTPRQTRYLKTLTDFNLSISFRKKDIILVTCISLKAELNC